MADDPIAQAAAALREAARTGRPIPPMVETWPTLDAVGAYAVQQVVIAHLVAAGDVVVGHKIGLTSAAMQRMLGIGEPDYGHLLASMRVTDAVSAQRFLAPRAEVEIAFVLGESLAMPTVTPEDVLRATAEVRTAIEIIDSRIVDWRIGLVDTVADNASSGAFALGARGLAPADVDLAALRGQLWHNGVLVAEGNGAAVLGHPARAVAWLANTLAGHGVTLQAGQVILSGACTRAVPVMAGDTVLGSVELLGQVEITFS